MVAGNMPISKSTSNLISDVTQEENKTVTHFCEPLEEQDEAWRPQAGESEPLGRRVEGRALGRPAGRRARGKLPLCLRNGAGSW